MTSIPDPNAREGPEPTNTLGRYGKYAGALPGSMGLPGGDADLHNNGDNPYADTSPARDLDDDTRRDFTVNGPSGGPAGPYYNPTPAVPTNPYAQGAGHYTPGEAAWANGMAGGLGADYDFQLGITTGGDAPNPYTDRYQHDIRVDNAQDDQLIPLDERR